MAIKNRCISLKIIFFEYLISMGIALILAFLIPYSLFSIGSSLGWYSYANASELQAQKFEKELASSQKFNRSFVPPTCSYVYLKADFSVVETDMNQQTLKNAVLTAKGEKNSAPNDEYFLTVKLNDGYCVLQYYIRSRYQSDWMEKYLPSPDRLLIIFSIVNCLLVCFALTTYFAKYLKKQLLPLMNATEKIKEQDLNFDVQPAKIKEFNHILVSISDMKSELKNSLERQWRMEQTKKEQLSALAHDIKTPLTIIRGNAELLEDSNQTEEQREFTSYILKNTHQMEQYLNLLISLTKAQNGYSIQLKQTDVSQFIGNLKQQLNALAATKQIKVNFSIKNLPNTFLADADLLQRAIMNVLSNAVDYTPKNDEITFTAIAINQKIEFCVIDTGKGFSSVDIKNAANQFYMGSKSRSQKNHYGIGLYIADSIVKQHKGTLSLSNSKVTQGGQVTIIIPIE